MADVKKFKELLNISLFLQKKKKLLKYYFGKQSGNESKH